MAIHKTNGPALTINSIVTKLVPTHIFVRGGTRSPWSITNIALHCGDTWLHLEKAKFGK